MYQSTRVLSQSLRQGPWNQLRFLTQVDVKTTEGSQSADFANAKPMSAIPGPTPFELVRGFLPGGMFYNKTLFEFTLAAREAYGDVVMLPSVFGKESMMLSFNVDDFPAIVRSEGIWPHRRGLETMTYHRSVRAPDTFGGVFGLLGTNDEKWGNLRSAVNPILMQPRNVRLYLNNMLDVNNAFLQRIRDIRDPNTLEMPDNFEEDFNCLTFESVAVVALNQQIGLLRSNRDKEAMELFKCLREFFNLVYDLEVVPSIWKIVKTPKFYKMMRTYDTMNRIIISYINKAIEKIESNTTTRKSDEEASVAEKLLKIDKRVAIVMALDMLMAGVDTTSTTLVGILLCLAKNPEKQEKLRQEILEILPQKDSILTVDSLKNLPYLRACIKEGIRVYPIGIGTLRTLGEDIVMSGYQVKKKQNVLVVSNPLLQEEAHVPRAKEFIPERWLRDEKNDAAATFNPFLYMPFGFGPRSCVGKRIVDLELEITISRLVRNFNIEFNYPIENAFKNKLINTPAIPLRFKFSEIEN